MPKPRLIDSIFFLILVSGPPKLSGGRDPTASLRGELSTVIVIHIALWLCCFFWVLYRIYPFVFRRGVIPSLWIPQFCGALFVFTLLLSVADSPGVLLTGFTIFQFSVMLGFAYVFVRAFGAEQYLQHLFIGFLIVMLLIVGAWLFMPELVVRGSAGRLRGDDIAPAGAVAALGMALLLSGIPRVGKSLFTLLLGLFLLVLLASQTRTAYLGIILVLLAGWLLLPNVPIRKSLPYVAVMAVLAALMDRLTLAQQYLVRDTESLATASDRLPLWEHLIGILLKESPLIGLGYFSASRVYGPQYNPNLGTAHSVFIEVLVGGGLLGAVFFVLLLSSLGWYAVRLVFRFGKNPLVYGAFSLLIIVFVFSSSGSEGIQSGPVGFTFWSLTALLPFLWSELARRHTRINLGSPHMRCHVELPHFTSPSSEPQATAAGYPPMRVTSK